MEFNTGDAIAVLERTPDLLESLLKDLPEHWTGGNEGPGSWSPYDVLGHLIHGEKTDWIPRMQIILSAPGPKEFEPFDRFAQFSESKGKSLPTLLEEFRALRTANLETLRSTALRTADLGKTGVHPTFGTVTLKQHLSTWVVHDLDHVSQIVRIMGSQYRSEVGPWREFLRILKE